MPSVEWFTTEQASSSLLQSIRALLDRAFAGDFSDDDWDHTLGGRHVVVREGTTPVAHAAVLERNLWVDDRSLRTGYVEGVATAPEREGKGLGSRVMEEVNGWVRNTFEMGALSTGRHSFYAHLGWERWQGPTYVMVGDERIRTAEEDDGIMVLRFGPSTGVDLSGALACEARTGDDW